MLTIEALRELYVKMGGSAADVADLELTPELIEAITNIYSGGGGSGLPEVTDADNGKALLVQEGAWDKGTLPSGLPTVTASDNNKSLRVVNGAWAVDANQFVATYTPDGQGSGTCDKTYAEIKAAISAGKEVIAHAINSVDEYETLRNITTKYEGTENEFITFNGYGIAYDEESGKWWLTVVQVVHASNGTLSVIIKNFEAA